MAKINLYNAEVSRRRLLTGVTAAAAGVALVGATECAFAKAKKSQAFVEYQDHPNGKERCENCEPFVAPDSCKTVEGVVSAQGWCKIYSAI